jgi:hypothetical protein
MSKQLKVGTRVVAIRNGLRYKGKPIMSFSSIWSDYKIGDTGRIVNIDDNHFYTVDFGYVTKEVCPYHDFEEYVNHSSYIITKIGGI